MNGTKTEQHSTMIPLSGKRVALYFSIFFIGLAVIDGIFVWIAWHTHPGIVTNRPYERGLNYNNYLDQYKNQQNSGLKEEFILSPAKTDHAESNSNAHSDGYQLKWRLLNRESSALNIDDFIIEAHRHGLPQTLRLRSKPDRHNHSLIQIDIPLAQKGRWDLFISARHAQGWFYTSHIISVNDHKITHH
jgi:nitrogen fixation protein FixH